MSSKHVIIIGAGIIGMTIAHTLKSKYPTLRITLLEKELDVGAHASGRNSGVLHAGFYYTADSLKAKFCAEGNIRMKAFCRANNLPINACQKVVVAKDETERKTLHTLYERGLKNGVDVKLITEEDCKKIDPAIVTYREALLSPSTATVDPRQVCHTLKKNLQAQGVEFVFNQDVKKVTLSSITSQNKTYTYDYLINCAGLYADKIAHQLHVGLPYTLIPFKGLYLKYIGKKTLPNIHIYPVPNINNPFLGVHFTKTVNGDMKIGPTAIPALWREHYGGFSRFNLLEMLQIAKELMILFWKNAFNFRKLAFSELKKYNPNVMIQEAKAMVTELDPQFKAMPAGIRAQLLDKRTHQLVMDFVVEHTPTSTHVLNAVSPAFTCSFAFADHVVNQINYAFGENA